LSRTFFKGGFIIPSDGTRRIIRDGGVLVEDDRIAMVGRYEDIRQYAAGADVINTEKCIIMPGMVDTHVHLAQALIRGVVPDSLSLIPWLKNWVWPLQGVYDSEDGKASAALCILEMLKTGTTCFVESLLHTRYGFDGIAELVKTSGIRGALSKSIMDLRGYSNVEDVIHPGMVEERDQCINEFKKMYRRWAGEAGGRIDVWLGLRSAGAVSDDLLRESAEIAAEYHTGITMHIAEIRDDVEYYRRTYSTSAAGFLERFGLLGDKRVFAHCVWLNAYDMSRFASTGSTVAHCPSSNLKLGSGIAPVSDMLRNGVNVGLGCDGGPSNDCYDMVREMKLASILQKGRATDPTSISAWDVVEMATRNGARAIGRLNELGSLENGKKADIVVVELRKPSVTPISNPLSLLVYSATGYDVRDVMIDGRFVVRDRRVLTLDEEQVLSDANTHLHRVLDKADIKADQLLSII
jgi:5-methylthioadenosine/S-adenosylhomocysteine deaminase